MALFGRPSSADLDRAGRVKAWCQARSPYALFSALLGVVAALDFFTIVLGVGLGATAVVLGVLGLRQIRRQPALLGRRLCISGIVLGCMGIAAAAIMWTVVYR